jgi:ABC-type phosphate transport system substrate-binding protein
MQRVRRVLVILAAVLFLFQVPPKHAAGAVPLLPMQRKSSQTLAIIVNRSNPVDNLSLAELRKIFLGRRSHWPNGRRIAMVMLEPGQPERETVLREIYRMTESEYQDHFLKGLFTGEVFISPKTLSSPAVVRKFVFNAPGAIGYLRESDVDESVKVIRVDGQLPDDRDYLLQIDARQVN